MTGLIDDLLDVSRVSRGQVTLDQGVQDVWQIVSSAVEQVRPLMDARRHQLTLPDTPVDACVYGDQKRLVQIIANILNNAAKYTPIGGYISLSIILEENSIRFLVTDDGIGMEPSVLNRMFEMFAQGERNSDRSQGGVGIGLAIVKNLVNLHGGSVTAHSDGLGKGSEFTVTLPRVAAAPDAAAAAHWHATRASSAVRRASPRPRPAPGATNRQPPPQPAAPVTNIFLPFSA